MSELENLSELFGTAAEDDGGSDFDAIFGDNAADEPLPMPEEVTASKPAEAAPTQEAESEPEETAAPAEEQTEPKEESKPKEEAKAAANPKSRKAKTQEKEAEPDLFSAFNDQEDTPPAPEPQTSVATAAAGQVSLFDKPALFSYGSAKEPIEDASMTFEELRIKKSEDFPELESGKTVSWRVRYGAVTKSITDPKESTIAKSKEPKEWRSGPYSEKPVWDQVILIGAVDNNRSRQLCHKVFYEARDLIYIDSGNGKHTGQVVCGIRSGGRTFYSPVGKMYPDVLKNTDKFPTELSCAEASVSAPQSITANITAATVVVDMIYNILAQGESRVRLATFSTTSCNVRATLQKQNTRRKAA